MAQVPWVQRTSGAGEIPPPTGTAQQTACLTADLNRDGAADMIVSSRGFGGRVQAWLSQASGAWQRVSLEDGNVQPEAGGATFDIDRDGDLDVVIGQDFAGASIYWWENPFPTFGSAWTRREIKNSGGTKHHDQIFGDFDGDGATELVSWNQNAHELLFYEIPSNPRGMSSPWSSRVIYTAPSDLYEGLAASDVDLDGVLDIVGAGRWWKHIGGGAFQENVVDAGMYFTRSAAGQLIPGGRPELVFVPGDAIGNGFWYEWNGSSWISHPLGTIYHGHTLDMADVDGNGALDLFIGEMKIGSPSCRVRVLYGNNAGSLTEQVLATGNDIHEGRLADLDGDGDLDIAHKPYNDGTPRLEIWLNQRAALPLDRWQRYLVDGALPYRAIFAGAGDCDGDGLKDLVAGGWWWKNPGALNGTWTRREIHVGSYLNYAAMFDADSDGDLDLLGTQGAGNTTNSSFSWAENRGAQGFQIRTNIAAGQGDFLQGVNARRFHGPSSAMEVALSWHDPSTGVQMLTVPNDPRTQTWTWQRIQNLSLGEDLASGDIDGDGDLDLCLGTVWLENPTWAARTLGIVSNFTPYGGTPEPDRVRLADLDGDHDLDAVMGLENGREVVWFENPRPFGAPSGTWTRRILGVFEGQGFSMDVADFDRDGDPDVVLGEHKGTTTNRVLLLQNDGTRQNWPAVTVDSQASNVIDHHDGTQAIDLDNDGDLDLVSIGWMNPKLWIFENRAILGGGGQPQQAQAPILSRLGSVFEVARLVTIEPAVAAQEIRYTRDGSDPTASSTLYTGPIALIDDTRIRARAFQTNFLPSAIVSADFARLPLPLTMWHFDEGSGSVARDSGRTARHGSIQGAVWSSGWANAALLFDPLGTPVTAGTFDAPPARFSLSGWIKADSFTHLANGDARIVTKTTGTLEQEHYWMLSTIAMGTEIRPRFRLKVNGTTRTLVPTSGNMATSTWTHVAGTFDGQNMVLYLNGSEVGRLAAPGTIDQDPGVQVWIGDNPPAGARPFDGLIDEVRLDDVALSALEISAMARYSPLPGVSHFGTPSPGCDGTSGIEALREASRTDPIYGFGAWTWTPGALGLFLIGAFPSAQGWQIEQARLWLDPYPGTIVTTGIAADGLGHAIVPISLPWLADDASAYAQVFWLNSAPCQASRGLFSASDGLRVIVQR